MLSSSKEANHICFAEAHKTKLVVKRYGHNENAGSPRKVWIVQNTLATADTVYVEH
jgi:hypothetical protein